MEQPLSLSDVARRLDEAGIPWALFAGAAARVYGARRPTTDYDILIPSDAGDKSAALFPEAAARYARDHVCFLELPGIDIVAGLTGLDLDAEMEERLVRHQVDGVFVPLIPPEDNILLKAAWGRGPEDGKHDWEDVEAMLAHVPGLDWDYLRSRAALLGRAYDLAPALERLEATWAAQQASA